MHFARIKLKSFTAHSDCNKVAKDIISHCKFIHHSKESFIISLLMKLQQRISRISNEKTENEELKQLHLELEKERNLRLQKEKELEAELEKERLRIKTAEKLIAEQKAMKEERLKILQKQKMEDIEKQKAEEEKKRLKEENEKIAAEKIKREQQKMIENKLKKERRTLAKLEKKRRKRLLKQHSKIEKEMDKNVPKKAEAIFGHLQSYIEDLYENDARLKIIATYNILSLVQQAQHLPHFVNDKILIGTLARIMNEDRKKNAELVSNILEIFFCFSNFTQIHHILIHYKIGATAMQIISHEIKFSTHVLSDILLIYLTGDMRLQSMIVSLETIINLLMEI